MNVSVFTSQLIWGDKYCCRVHVHRYKTLVLRDYKAGKVQFKSFLIIKLPVKLSVSVSVRLSLCLLLKLWTPQKGSGDVSQLFFFLLAQRWYSPYSCLLWVMTSPTSSSLRKQTDSKPCRIIIILQRWLSTYCCHRTWGLRQESLSFNCKISWKIFVWMFSSLMESHQH